MTEPIVSAGPVARMHPDDLKLAAGHTPPRRLCCRLLAVDVRRTQHGQSWASLELLWRGRVLRGAVFPREWRALRVVPDLQVGNDYVLIGSVGFRDSTPLILVQEISEQVLRLVSSDGVGTGR